MVERAEDIIYYEETVSDGTVVYRCDYKGIAIRKPKSMLEGRREIEIKQEFFDAIANEDETIYDISKHAEENTSEEI